MRKKSSTSALADSFMVSAKRIGRRYLPTSTKKWLRERLHRSAQAFPSGKTHRTYETLYENQAKALPTEVSIGDGDYDLIGRTELGLLVAEGLKSDATLVDMGCGTGRLTVHVLPYLHNGHYMGTDISKTMLDAAKSRAARLGTETCRLSWIKQPLDRYPLDNDSVDMICAFSVFTHMEPEDHYRYLKDALRVVRPGGKFLFSCLPMESAKAKEVFLASAALDFESRWRVVRNFVTSEAMARTISELAGWRVVNWYRGDESKVLLTGSREYHSLRQSTCVLEKP